MGGVQSIGRLFLDFDRRQIRLVDCTDCRTPEIIQSLTLHVNRHVPYLYSVNTKLVKNRRKNKGGGDMYLQNYSYLSCLLSQSTKTG